MPEQPLRSENRVVVLARAALRVVSSVTKRVSPIIRMPLSYTFMHLRAFWLSASDPTAGWKVWATILGILASMAGFYYTWRTDLYDRRLQFASQKYSEITKSIQLIDSGKYQDRDKLMLIKTTLAEVPMVQNIQLPAEVHLWQPTSWFRDGEYPYREPLRFLIVSNKLRLAGADLSHAYLEGADLREADLRGTSLRFANLRDADLRDARLRGQGIKRAVLDTFADQAVEGPAFTVWSASVIAVFLQKAHNYASGHGMPLESVFQPARSYLADVPNKDPSVFEGADYEKALEALEGLKTKLGKNAEFDEIHRSAVDITFALTDGVTGNLATLNAMKRITGLLHRLMNELKFDEENVVEAMVGEKLIDKSLFEEADLQGADLEGAFRPQDDLQDLGWKVGNNGRLLRMTQD